MSEPIYSIQDFTGAFKSLLPRGRVWPRDEDSIIGDFCSAMAPSAKRVTDAAVALLIDAFPSTTVQLLPEWEASLGLPDPCAGPSQTIQQRQQQVLAKFTNSGGQSANYFISILASLGFTGITISNYAPFRVGINHIGDPLYSGGWAYTWLITAPNLNVVYFRAGKSTVGEALYNLTNAAVLECIVREYAPAHTNPLFGEA